MLNLDLRWMQVKLGTWKKFSDSINQLDYDGLHAVIKKSIHLANRKHSITVEYFENTGSGELRFQYNNSNIVKQVIPSDMLLFNEKPKKGFNKR